MTKKPNDTEIKHGISLLRNTQNWEGPVTVVTIDPVCKWRLSKDLPSCDAPVENVVVLLRKEADNVEAIALCQHHTNCMLAALQEWRQMT